MTKLLARVGISVAAASVFAATLVPASALAGGGGGNSCLIKNNGFLSNNRCKITEVNVQLTKQINIATILNGVFVVAGTGGNTANANTGGDASITSGGVTVNITITNDVNQNTPTPSPTP